MAVVDEAVEQTLGDVGRRVAEARRTRGLTHEQVAALTGLSAPYLSRIETGKRQPSLATMLSLARVLKVDLGRLVDADDGEVSQVVRGAHAREQRGNGLRFRVLSSGGSDFEAMKVTVPASRTGDTSYSHGGQEWIYVQSGRLQLTLGEREIDLDVGDAMTFDAQQPHRLTALDAEDVELLLVAVAPRSGLLSSYVARSA
jgi:transcriptional regulator with XRE-family HTH domain